MQYVHFSPTFSLFVTLFRHARGLERWEVKGTLPKGEIFTQNNRNNNKNSRDKSNIISICRRKFPLAFPWGINQFYLPLQHSPPARALSTHIWEKELMEIDDISSTTTK